MSRTSVLQPFGLPWPLPAVGAWGCAWAMFICLVQIQWPSWLALACACVAPAAVASLSAGWTKRVLVLAGFPLSAVLAGQAGMVPPWAWLLPLLLLLAIYPLRAWKDAPVFPTDADALRGLAERCPMATPPRILDAGSGLGHGLRALHGQWPGANLLGVESSAILVLISRLACPFAQVRRADMWEQSWSEFDLVYLFQRPESMPHAWHKACSQMRPGSWLVSLEFAVPDVQAQQQPHRPGRRPVWIYQVPHLPVNSTAQRRDR